jgi:hypothetical protein
MSRICEHSHKVYRGRGRYKCACGKRVLVRDERVTKHNVPSVRA